MKKMCIALLLVSSVFLAVSCSDPTVHEAAEDQTEASTSPTTTSGDNASMQTPEQHSFPTETITRPDVMIYTGPGYDYEDTGTLLIPGTYGITEETVDGEGFRWGKLESGAGWIDLDKALAPAPHILLTLERTTADAAASMDCIRHTVDESAYTHWLLLRCREPLTDIRLTFMDFTEDSLRPGEELFTLEEMTADTPMVIGVVFYGDLTTYGLSCTDAEGVQHQFILYTSGRNGSVILQEYEMQ